MVGHFAGYMPAQIDPRLFVETLLPVVRQCARASLIFYGQVADIGKAPDTRLIGRVAQQASGVLTVLDCALQDLILSAALGHFPGIGCIAEEATPLRRRFAGKSGKYTLILDPIDGTLHYQRGDEPYHISVGLAREGRMEAAIVARPSEDKIFTAVRGRGAFLQQGKGQPRRLRLGARPRTRRLYVSTKARPYQAAFRPRYEPQEFPIGAALVLTRIAEGRLCAYLTRQVAVYDVGPPSLIAEEAGARCFLKDGGEPRYRGGRKFGYYLCAATPQLQELLLEVVRGGKGEKA
jgi:fructose-1,6-bisphosphatase/inositol monophosphatase family enzyme